jgi:hypothetical protein
LAIWDNIWRELQNLYEILTGGEPTPDETPEETDTEPGGFFGGEEPPEEPPAPPFFGGDDEEEQPPGFGQEDDEDRGYFGYNAGDGPYMFDWYEEEQRFWDRIADQHYFLSQENYNEAQEQFNLGFIALGDEVSTRDREEARERFLDEMLWTEMDWDAFKDYYSEV